MAEKQGMMTEDLKHFHEVLNRKYKNWSQVNYYFETTTMASYQDSYQVRGKAIACHLMNFRLKTPAYLKLQFHSTLIFSRFCYFILWFQNERQLYFFLWNGSCNILLTVRKREVIVSSFISKSPPKVPTNRHLA